MLARGCVSGGQADTRSGHRDCGHGVRGLQHLAGDPVDEGEGGSGGSRKSLAGSGQEQGIDHDGV